MADLKKIIIDYNNAINNFAWKSTNNLNSVIVSNCPTVESALDLLKLRCFQEHFSKQSEYTIILFKLNEDFSNESIQNINLNNVNDCKIVVALESTNIAWIVWKLNDQGNVELMKTPFLGLNMKETFNFTLNFFENSLNTGAFVPDRYNEYLSTQWDSNIFCLADSRGYNLLMLAVEAGNLQVVNQLLNIGFNVNITVDGKNAIDIAWENRQQEAVLTLLKANSRYPTSFVKEYEAVELIDRLKTFTEEIKTLFIDIENGNLQSIANFISNNHELRHIFNYNNISAPAYAISKKQFEVYKLLMENNIFLARDEKMEETAKDLTKTQLWNLKTIHDTYSKENSEKHIKILSSISKVSPDEENVSDRMRLIEQAFIDLNKVQCVSSILKAVAKVPDSIIYFDFNREWVNYMAPTSSRGVNGLFFMSGRVYIACKNLLIPNKRNDALGVIAHELCHYAVFLTFKNKAKPYTSDDNERFNEFNEIVEELQQTPNENHEKIVGDVFEFYSLDLYHAELIVRVPQLLTFYHGDPVAIQRCRTQYPKLFAFFETFVIPQIDEKIPTIESFFVQKLKEDIKKRDIQIRDKNDEIDAADSRLARVKSGDLDLNPVPQKCLLPIIEVKDVKDVKDKKTLLNYYKNIDETLLADNVRGCNVVVISIVGFMNSEHTVLFQNCLKYLNHKYKLTHSKTDDWMDQPNSSISWYSINDGIHFWSEVFLHKPTTKEKIAIVLMCTEISDDLSSNIKEKLLRVNLLLSSVQLISLEGSISYEDSQILKSAFELRIHSSNSVINKNVKTYQKLILTLHDWEDESIVDGSFSQLCNNINFEEYFNNIELFVVNYKTNPKNSTDFNNKLKNVVESILKPNQLIKKILLGVNVTAVELRDLAFDYMKIYRQLETPSAGQILHIMTENTLKLIIKKKLRLYQCMMDREIDLFDDTLLKVIDEKHNKAKTVAITDFYLTLNSTWIISNQTSLEEGFIARFILEMDAKFKKWKTNYDRLKPFKDEIKKLTDDVGSNTESIKQIKYEMQKLYEDRIKKEKEFEEKINRDRENLKLHKAQVDGQNLENKEKENQIKLLQNKFEEQLKEHKEALSKEFDQLIKNKQEAYTKNDMLSSLMRKLFKIIYRSRQ